MDNCRFTTWNGIDSCTPELFFKPSSTEELREILIKAKLANRRVKVIGSGHSMNRLACTDGYMIDLQEFDKVINVDSQNLTICVEAGIKLTRLCEDVLPKQGLALSVLSVISDQSLGGAISTCTHGSGLHFGIMASYIIDMKIMTSSGEIIRCSKDEKPELFSAACCGLGALGVILSATIQCEKAFNLHETTTPIRFDEMVSKMDDYLQSGDHVHFFWVPNTDHVVMYCALRTDGPATAPPTPSWFWNSLVANHLFQSLYWISDYFQRAIPWINWAFYQLFLSRLSSRVGASHRVFTLFVPMGAANEWAVPLERAADVLRELKRLADAGKFYAHFPLSVRFAKPDDIMLSPSYKRNMCFINPVFNMQVFSYQYV
nr:L-gulonolactone oxidase-like [Lytechinus pictus]